MRAKVVQWVAVVIASAVAIFLGFQVDPKPIENTINKVVNEAPAK